VDTLNTTNIKVPDSILNGISFVSIKFYRIEITQITKPLLSAQLANLLSELAIECLWTIFIIEKDFGLDMVLTFNIFRYVTLF
jgi:hypothetical protein